MKFKSLNNIKTIQHICAIVFIIVSYISSIYSNTYFSWWYLALLFVPIFNYLRGTNRIDFIIQKKWFSGLETFFNNHPNLYKSFLLLILLFYILFKIIVVR